MLACMSQREQRRAEIAGEIRAELARQNKTATQLSVATGISSATLSRRLSGLKPFYLEELEDISRFLGLPAWAFTERAEARIESEAR